MKSNLMVILSLGSGLFLGMEYGEEAFRAVESLHSLPTLLLYALIFQVGLKIGANGELKPLLKNIRPSVLLLPLGTIVGTLSLTALGAVVIDQWSAMECMAVGSGFGYYSLSSMLITQLKEPSLGLELATQLGAVALLANILRELLAMVGSPLYARLFGRFAPIMASGSPSMDVCLPIISRTVGAEMVPLALMHGMVIDLLIPILVTFFCQ